ncbi:hypothetical protein [Lentzea flaviverrucosa]|uniref:Tryptophan-associated transmembrane protein (Trp_oprn_chp) n=1 Tax=Lentzea flaviverrucosa TaxID=200379 RepID=A0A1H9XXY7_9PSEU|nr:hypothetical protein [Lentzea flaviverrucosa]RDI16527.1 hypothetical protein DFR72_1249 [Lentzea flaviverrucosa]SES51055.1 hypothetical protein SAMN05216195_12468 [Lentzea flaviverrucosa]
MIDRRKISWVLLALGAVLSVVASLQAVFSTIYKGMGTDLTVTTTLWITTSDPQNGPVEQPAFFAAGWPVVVSAIVMAVSVALMVRESTAFAGRPLAVGGAGALAGIVLLYVVQVKGLEEIVTSQQQSGPGKDEMHYHGGFYLLVVAAFIGLAGAVLAQRRSPEPVVEDDDEGEEVVVHQLGGDDDTPPFGLAIPHDDEQREVR